MSQISISAIMPLYNTERYVEAAVRSIQRQTFSDWELLIMDDGSTDGSRKIVEDLAREDSRVRVFASENAGAVAARNRLLAEAKGEYVALMDSDDIAFENRFEVQFNFLETHSDHLLIGSQVLLIDAEDAPLRLGVERFSHEEIDEFHLQRNTGAAIVHPSAMFRLPVVRELGAYREGTFPAEDIDLFLRLAEKGRIANLPQVLLHYRIHAASAGHAKRQRQLEQIREARRQAYSRRGLPWEEPAKPITMSTEDPHALHERWAWWALMGGYPASARKHAWKALRQAPWRPRHWKVMACAMRGY